MRRPPCAYLPIVAALAGGCFNPAGSGETSGSTGSPEVTSSTGEPPSTSTGPTTSTGSTTTSTGSSGPGSSSGEPSSTGVLPGTGTTGTSDTGDTTGGDPSTGVEPSVCGNHLIEGIEACDDGGVVAGDGCSEVCQREDLVVFVTNQAFNVGQIMNLATADNLCVGMAQTGSLPAYAKNGLFVAWLSDGITSAKQRIGDSPLPYRLVDRSLVAANTDALLNNMLLAPIHLDQFGTPVPNTVTDCGEPLVWTGTNPQGTTTQEHCEGWTSLVGSASATIGSAVAMGPDWTQGATCNCTKALRIYCIEVP